MFKDIMFPPFCDQTTSCLTMWCLFNQIYHQSSMFMSFQ